MVLTHREPRVQTGNLASNAHKSWQRHGRLSEAFNDHSTSVQIFVKALGRKKESTRMTSGARATARAKKNTLNPAVKIPAGPGEPSAEGRLSVALFRGIGGFERTGAGI